jgi:hypothetical protein
MPEADIAVTIPRRQIAMFLLLAALPTVLTASVVWSAFPGSMLTPNRATVIQDYIVMWVSGRIALAGDTHALATVHGYNAWIATLLGPGIDTYYWLYAPHLLLLSAPLALLSPLPSLADWTGLSLGLLWMTMRLAGVAVLGRIAVMLSPAALENMLDGQNGALLTAAMVGGLTLAGRSPWLAGLFVSVLTLKPQLAIVVPICLVASRNWRTLGWALFFSIGWIGVSLLCFGVEPWLDYVTSILPQARALHLGLDTVPFGTLYLQYLVVTPFAAARSAGAGLMLAEVVQAGVTILVLALVWRLWSPRAAATPSIRLAFALAAVPLVTPYAMTYDMIGTALACALMLSERPSPARVCAMALAWAWPGLSLYAALLFGLPGLGAGAFVLLATAVWCQARKTRPVPFGQAASA